MSLAWRLAQLMGVITGALSLFALCRQLLNFGLSGPMQIMLNYYHNVLNVLLGWADIPLADLISYLSSFLGLALHLNSNWKHIFVLMWLYFWLDTRTNVRERKIFALFGIFLGLAITALTIIAMGIEEGGSIYGAVVPMLGIFLWETIRNLFSSLFHISTSSYDAKNKDWTDIFAFRFVRFALPTLGMTVVVSALTFLESV